MTLHAVNCFKALQNQHRRLRNIIHIKNQSV